VHHLLLRPRHHLQLRLLHHLLVRLLHHLRLRRPPRRMSERRFEYITRCSGAYFLPLFGGVRRRGILRSSPLSRKFDFQRPVGDRGADTFRCSESALFLTARRLTRVALQPKMEIKGGPRNPGISPDRELARVLEARPLLIVGAQTPSYGRALSTPVRGRSVLRTTSPTDGVLRSSSAEVAHRHTKIVLLADAPNTSCLLAW